MDKLPNDFVLPLHHKEFSTSTADWTDAEVGCYIRLLIYQWANGSITDDLTRLQRISDSIHESKEVVLQKFNAVDNSPGRMQNPRMEAIRSEKIDYHTKKSNAGKKGMESRYQNNNKHNNKVSNKRANKNITKEGEGEEEGIGIKGKVKFEVVFPFDSENFTDHWTIWKNYKKDQHHFSFKSVITEQAALNNLVNLSQGSEEKSIQIIMQSIENSWKGFFELKNSSNGTQGTQSKSDQLRTLRTEVQAERDRRRKAREQAGT